MMDRLSYLAHRRWHRTIAVVLAAALTTAVATALLDQTNDHDPPRHSDRVPLDQRVFSPGERLIPELSFTIRHPAEQPPVEPKIPFFEVLADGAVHELPLAVPDHTAVDQLRPLADGRLAVRGSRDLMPDIDRPDGPFVDGVEFPLVLIDVNGNIESSQDLRKVGEHVSIMGASATDVVLQRFALDSTGQIQQPVRITAHGLAGGEERTLWESTRAASHGDLDSDRLLLAGGGINDPAGDAEPGDPPRCWLHSRDLTPAPATNDQITRTTVPVCHQVVDVNTSPDGRFAAVVYERWATPPQLRLRTLDLPDMAVLSDEFLGSPTPACAECIATTAMADYLGMAWSDAAVLHVARMEPLPLPPDPDHVLADIQDRLRILAQPTIDFAAAASSYQP